MNPSPILKKIHDPGSGRLRVSALISGSGTNLLKILEHQRRLETERGVSPFEIVVIFSDNPKSKAAEIGAGYNLPVVTRDIASFYREKGLPRKDLSVRPEFDRGTVEVLKPFGATVAAYAGYMSVASPVLVNAFTGINVHPADLGRETPDGKRRWVGDHAVADAIKGGETHICSSTHIVEETVDCGRLLMISSPLKVDIPAGADISTPEGLRAAEVMNQDRLKEHGDWVIFPLTLEYIADGRFSIDRDGVIHFDGKSARKGVRLQSA